MVLTWSSRIKLLCVGIAFALLVVGCRVEYKITMLPVDGGLHRTTVVRGEIEPLEQQTLTNVFGEPEQVSDVNTYPKKVMYTGEVAGDAWADGLGGLGSWSEVISPLGSATIFMESFGGDAHVADDLVALLHLLDVIEASIQDRLIEAMKDESLLPTIRTELHNRVLPDAKDLLLMLWAQSYQASDETSDDETSDSNDVFVDQRTSLIASFLWQRGWINSGEAAMLFNTAPDMSAGIGKLINNRCLARALDLDIDSTDGKQKFDQLQERFSTAFDEAFWDSIEEKVDKEIGDRIRMLVTLALKSPKVSATLEANTPPTLTNGNWNEEEKSVTFKLDKPPLAIGLIISPVHWRASWVEPNTSTQQKLFGEVVVTGENLLAFCLGWQCAKDEAREEVQLLLTKRGSAYVEGESVDSKAMVKECLYILHENQNQW